MVYISELLLMAVHLACLLAPSIRVCITGCDYASLKNVWSASWLRCLSTLVQHRLHPRSTTLRVNHACNVNWHVLINFFQLGCALNGSRKPCNGCCVAHTTHWIHCHVIWQNLYVIGIQGKQIWGLKRTTLSRQLLLQQWWVAHGGWYLQRVQVQVQRVALTCIVTLDKRTGMICRQRSQRTKGRSVHASSYFSAQYVW